MTGTSTQAQAPSHCNELLKPSAMDGTITSKIAKAQLAEKRLDTIITDRETGALADILLKAKAFCDTFIPPHELDASPFDDQGAMRRKYIGEACDTCMRRTSWTQQRLVIRHKKSHELEKLVGVKRSEQCKWFEDAERQLDSSLEALVEVKDWLAEVTHEAQRRLK